MFVTIEVSLKLVVGSFDIARFFQKKQHQEKSAGSPRQADAQRKNIIYKEKLR